MSTKRKRRPVYPASIEKKNDAETMLDVHQAGVVAGVEEVPIYFMSTVKEDDAETMSEAHQVAVAIDVDPTPYFFRRAMCRGMSNIKLWLLGFNFVDLLICLLLLLLFAALNILLLSLLS